MFLLANMPSRGTGLPLCLTSTIRRFPPLQLWLKKCATLLTRVASTLMRRQALQDGSHSRTTYNCQEEDFTSAREDCSIYPFHFETPQCLKVGVLFLPFVLDRHIRKHCSGMNDARHLP